MYKIGEWAEVVNFNPDFNGTIGYIVNIAGDNDQVQFKAVRHPKRGRMTGKRWFESEFIMTLGTSLDKAHLDSLIDLSLDIGDKEWFHELSKMRASCG